METEPKLAKADVKIAEQGRKCHRFGDEGWKNIRYAEVQKMFHATPVFSALRVNSALAATTPSWTSLTYLEKIDTTLGALTHGLLQQRDAFQEACKSLEPKTQLEIQKRLLSDDSKFRKISDALLQYTCGRRAEVIQSRRETYKSSNKILNDILHDIPPSETHLFAEQRLNDVLKEQGGLHKFFPKKPLQNTKPGKPQLSAHKGPIKPRYDTQQRPNNRTNKKQLSRNFRPSGKQPTGNNRFRSAPTNTNRKSQF